MQHYFDTILKGYKTETSISDELVNQLPLFIDMVLIENIVDEFECAAREGEEYCNLPDNYNFNEAFSELFD